MTDNSRKVLEALKAAGVGVKFTTKQMQELLGFEKPGSVTGSVTGLCRKGRAERCSETVVNDEGKEVKVNYFYLTEEGMAFDPDAE